MYEQDGVITTKHGRMPAFLACPDETGPYFRHGCGRSPRGAAQHGAPSRQAGDLCFFPDTYYRLAIALFDFPRRDDSMSGVIRDSMNSITNALVTDDTAAMVAWI